RDRHIELGEDLVVKSPGADVTDDGYDLVPYWIHASFGTFFAAGEPVTDALLTGPLSAGQSLVHQHNQRPVARVFCGEVAAHLQRDEGSAEISGGNHPQMTID